MFAQLAFVWASTAILFRRQTEDLIRRACIIGDERVKEDPQSKQIADYCSMHFIDTVHVVAVKEYPATSRYADRVFELKIPVNRLFYQRIN
jgi:hypothetical protein